ncbi:NHL repeat-containing protein [Candidatus Poribacteria bacterium]|nr:NHL repeat-containing protein [Candidatus Poribacteria bacterium]
MKIKLDSYFLFMVLYISKYLSPGFNIQNKYQPLFINLKRDKEEIMNLRLLMNCLKSAYNFKIIFLILISISIFFPHYKAYSDNVRVRKSKFVTTISSVKKPFNAYDVAVDKNTDTIYIPNNATKNIEAYDIEGRLVLEIGEQQGSVSLQDMRGIWVDNTGNVYVVSQGAKQIYVFNSRGDLMLKFPTEDHAWDIVTNSLGDILVSINEFGKGRILIYNNEGKYKYAIKKIVLDENKKYDFGDPVWMTITSDDRLFVTDAFHQMIFIFDIKGKAIGIFGGAGDIVGKFFAVSGISVDNKNRIYVVDKIQRTIQMFTNAGEFLSIASNENGQPLDLAITTGIDFDSKHRLYCFQSIICKIAVFEFIDK